MKIINNKNLKNILNKWDLLGVMPFRGGPKDEYDWFAQQIAQKLKNDISSSDLEKYLEDQIVDYFGLSLNNSIKKNIQKYSLEIMELTKE